MKLKILVCPNFLYVIFPKSCFTKRFFENNFSFTNEAAFIKLKLKNCFTSEGLYQTVPKYKREGNVPSITIYEMLPKLWLIS
jgi:hypothetical protein